MQAAYLDLPTLANSAIGDIVTGHFAQKDRSGRIEEIMGERALVSFTLKDGSARRRWVRSNAPVKQTDDAAAALFAAASLCAVTRRWLDEARRREFTGALLTGAEQRHDDALDALSAAYRAANDAKLSHVEQDTAVARGKTHGLRLRLTPAPTL